MKWSKYSLLFESAGNGWLLYNAASNTFLKPEEETVPVIREIISAPDSFDYTRYPQLYFTLRAGGFWVEDNRDEELYQILKMRRLTQNYASPVLMLTIAPTRACNFACPYCFEGNRTGGVMDEETEDKIIRFVRLHKKLDQLAVVWYGGEPLLAFERMLSLNRKLQETQKRYTAQIITNGYCLTQEVTDRLEELHVKSIQITLDGGRSTHDSRRYLAGGGATYDVILSNLDRLMKSDWEGQVRIRVNIDASNSGEYASVERGLRERYQEGCKASLSVYPGFVHGDGNPDLSCYYNAEDKGRFLQELLEQHDLTPLPVFPRLAAGGCTMTKRNAYVIGPEGELYKCWNDVGDEKAVIGHVDSLNNWNMALVAEGMTGNSYLDSEECRECFCFPICDGGCARVRVLMKRDGRERDHCSYFKSHIKELLELYYEHKYKKPQ